ncbi:MAG: hypothetical protein WBW33_09725 [Bryobacteraceae bacterium]
MSEWQGRDRTRPEDPARKAPPEDRILGGVSGATWDHWGKIYAEALEYLHQQKELPGRSAPGVDELVAQGEEQRALYEQMYGLRIMPQRPHEYAFALVLRPFSRSALNGEIPLISASRLSPGYCFIGLEREGEPAVPVGLITSHRIASAADLKAAYATAAAARPNGFVFFQAADTIWKEVVTQFAGFSAAILVDLSESTDGLEWEFETLVPKYGPRFVCYAINAESRPFGPWQERLTAGLEIHPIVSRRGQTVAARMFSDLVSRRVGHDRAIVNNAIARAMRPMPWGQDFTAGLEALAASDPGKASKCLQLAWDCATRLTTHPMMLVYPGVALADALTLTGDRAMRHSVLKRAAGVTGSPQPSTELERHKIDVRLIRQLLGLAHPDLLLAIWQFHAVLGDGLSSELCMTHHLQVAIEWEARMGPADTGSAVEMLSWHADEAVRLARELKAPFIEVDALLPAAAARRTLGDIAGCLERARAGSELAARLGNTALAEGFAELLESGR